MSKSILILPPYVLPFQRNSKLHCELCNLEFSILKREHLCKRCCRTVCHDCSPHKVSVFRADRHCRLHRMCNICYEESCQIRKYIERNKVMFGQNSDLVGMWSKQLNTAGKKLKEDREGKNYIDIMQLWESLNYSFREFVGYAIEQSKMSDSVVLSNVNWGLTQLAKLDLKLPLEDILYIYLYFLCNCTPETAVNLTICLVSMIKDYRVELDNIVINMKTLGCSQMDSYKIQQYLQPRIDSIFNKVSINCFTASVSVAIVNSVIMEGNLTSMEKYLAALMLAPGTIGQNKGSLAACSVKTLKENISIIDRKSAELKRESPERGNEIMTLKLKFQRQEETIEELKRQVNQGKKSVRFRSDEDTKQNREMITELLEQKNMEIKSLRQELASISSNSGGKIANLEKSVSDKSEQLAKSIKEGEQKEKKIAKLTEENEALKNMNSLLLKKMKELGELLMDKEEKVLQDSQSRLISIKQEVQGETGLMLLGKQKDCVIY